MKSSISSPELKINLCEKSCGRQFASKFNSDDSLSAILSVAASDNVQKQKKALDNQLESDLGANNSLINQ